MQVAALTFPMQMPPPGYTPAMELPYIPAPEPLFHSADAALRFALTVDDASLSRPSIASMIKSVVSGRRCSLRGMDRAAQAGMILHYLHKLGPLREAVLIAAAAPPANRCSCRAPCCSGWRVNRYWADAIGRLKWECRAALPKATSATEALRAAILVKIYGREKLTFERIAQENGGRVDPDTVSKHYRAILRWAKGGRDKGGIDIDGVEQRAWAALESALWDAGIVGEA